MTIDWQTLAALVVSFTGMAALAIFTINAVIEKRLREFLVQLNGTYLRRELAKEQFANMDRRIDELHGYTHGFRHEVANELMKIRGVTD